MKTGHRRLTVIFLCLLGIGTATALVLAAFEDNILFFYAPSDLAAEEVRPGQRIRIGGLVADGSVTALDDGPGAAFEVTDGAETLTVVYRGLLPDLFREGQGVVAHGTLDGGGRFVADEVLAKHDETYMPPEVAEALARSGHAGAAAE